MLNIKQGFIQSINNTHDTDETIQVAAVMARHKETTGEHDWLRKGPDNQQTTSGDDNETSEKLDWQFPDPSALEQLKKLAANAVEKAEAQYKQEGLTIAILETLANGGNIEATCEIPSIEMVKIPSTQFASEEIDEQATRYEIPSIPKSDSGNRRVPTKYQNCTLSPYILLISSIIENRRYIGDDALPSNLYVSDTLLWQLHKDMKHCINQDFNGKSIPFMQLDGNKIDIPILSAKAELGVDLPTDMVWCSNGIAS